MIDLDEIFIESFSGNKKNIREVHRFQNGDLVASAFFENLKKIRDLNFKDPERFETIYEHHEHYYLQQTYDRSKNITGCSISIKNPFKAPDQFETYALMSKEWLEKNIEEENALTKFIILKADNDEISYTFKGERLTEVIFDIKGYEDSYHITTVYSEDQKTCHVWKKYINAEYPTVMKTYEFTDNMVIEREGDRIKYIVSDETDRVIRIGDFLYNEEKLHLFKHYMQTEDQDTFSKIMKHIHLEIFNYDEFDNLTLHETSFYRPDFSKDRLTPQLEEIEYFDQYNIHYGSVYCKTKDDYDDYSGGENRLEYLEGRVNEYNKKDELIAIHYIENEKKTHAEFFSSTNFSTEKYDEYGNTIEWYTENKVTNTIETIKQEIIYQ
ncbi:hypothetical protein P2W68_07480 [Chryseobacterium arthrosphaerae]|uniref:hypothetical protein n=1 Tax=Chryseobacterium arthrosphaerae TaxID=651561 RepID=UPI0023E2B2D4|nr:hypothetical protein [Chryseobacterium arthrosphaerae]WES99450.1 hypothetical protein P2W68_07480 [Chryseobacterium arthrosphaerae]